MAKIKIYIDARCLVRDNPSGVGHYMASLLKSIDLQLDELYAPKNIKYHLIVPFRKAWKIDQYEFRNFKIKKIYLPLRAMNLLARKKLLPPLDLMFGRGVYVFPEFVKLPLLFSKSVTILYDAAYEILPNSVERKMLYYLRDRIASTIRHSTKLVTISNSARDDLARVNHLNKDSFTVIKPSVDKSIFYPRSAREINKIKARYEIFDDYILAVGNLEPRKNLVKLFDAYVSLPQAVRDKYCLLVVGASSWNTEDIYTLQATYKEQGHKIITRLGAVPDTDMPAIYSGSSLFVYPSLYEGFGMPILESMACGTPVLAGKNSSLPEATGNAAIIIDEKSSSSIAEAIEKQLTNPELLRHNREKGYKHIDQLNSWTESAILLQDTLVSAQQKKIERLS